MNNSFKEAEKPNSCRIEEICDQQTPAEKPNSCRIEEICDQQTPAEKHNSYCIEEICDQQIPAEKHNSYCIEEICDQQIPAEKHNSYCIEEICDQQIYDLNCLLDKIIEILCLKNDAELSCALGIKLTVIKKIRCGSSLDSFCIGACEQEKYNPDRLLDKLICTLCLKNDAALARLLEVAPPVISKIRHRRLPVGASLLIRMHEVSKLSVQYLRCMMGDRRCKYRISHQQYKPKEKHPNAKKIL